VEGGGTQRSAYLQREEEGGGVLPTGSKAVAPKGTPSRRYYESAPQRCLETRSEYSCRSEV
jgi:hypothetical protein